MTCNFAFGVTYVQKRNGEILTIELLKSVNDTEEILSRRVLRMNSRLIPEGPLNCTLTNQPEEGDLDERLLLCGGDIFYIVVFDLLQEESQTGSKLLENRMNIAFVFRTDVNS